MKFENLSWDSNFFKFKVCSITGTVNSVADLAKAETYIAENKCRLTYLNLNQAINDEVLKHARLEIKLVDKKITYSKTISNEIEINPIIISVNEGFRDNHLLNIAYESGIYSRFKVDEKIETNIE